MYYVYRIEVENTTRYIGYTENLEIRKKQHNYLCFKTQKKKILYQSIRKLKTMSQIELIPIKSMKTKIDAKRYECFLILNDYFNKKQLWQKVPRITDF